MCVRCGPRWPRRSPRWDYQTRKVSQYFDKTLERQSWHCARRRSPSPTEIHKDRGAHARNSAIAHRFCSTIMILLFPSIALSNMEPGKARTVTERGWPHGRSLAQSSYHKLMLPPLVFLYALPNPTAHNGYLMFEIVERAIGSAERPAFSLLSRNRSRLPNVVLSISPSLA